MSLVLNSLIVWVSLLVIHDGFVHGDTINVGIPWQDDVSNATQWLNDSVYETNNGDLVHGLFRTQEANGRRFTFGSHNSLRLVKCFQFSQSFLVDH